MIKSEKTYKGLPLLDLEIIDDSCGIESVALVRYPATQTNWQWFDADVKCFSFDEDRHLITSVLMVADTPIYRRDPDGTEYYVQYTKESLEVMALKFVKDGRLTKVNLEHTDTYVDGLTVTELFFKNIKRGINPVEFVQIPDGSLFVTYKVENDVVWSLIKDKLVSGFSLQGQFAAKIEEETPPSSIEELNSLIREVEKERC